MLGTLLTAGVGVLAFRLGAASNKLASQGKCAVEILPALGEQLCSDVRCGYCWCREKLANAVGYTFECEEEEEPVKAPPKRSHHKKKPEATASSPKAASPVVTV